MTAAPILVARDLVKVYRRGATEVRAVDGVSLEVPRGEMLAIMGRSGSGKTTLLDLLGCLMRPTSGDLAVDGRSVAGASDADLATIRRERIGFVFQEFNLIPTLTAVENVLLPLRYGPKRGGGRASVASSPSSGRSARSRSRSRPSTPATSRGTRSTRSTRPATCVTTRSTGPSRATTGPTSSSAPRG